MATCYRCGQPIASTDFKLRRKVKTGETVNRRYPNPSISSIRTTWGIRLVCVSCARAIDWETRRRELVQWYQLGLAVLVIIILLVLKTLS